jgi:hypothetical protein
MIVELPIEQMAIDTGCGGEGKRKYNKKLNN